MHAVYNALLVENEVRAHIIVEHTFVVSVYIGGRVVTTDTETNHRRIDRSGIASCPHMCYWVGLRRGAVPL